MDQAAFPSWVMKQNRKFRRDYDRLFRHNPAAANLLLLLAELADERGQVRLGPCPESEIANLMEACFDDPKAYQLPGRPKSVDRDRKHEKDQR